MQNLPPGDARAAGSAMLGVIVALWALGLVGGFGWLAEYKATPGAVTTPAARWPSGTSLHRDPGRPTLVMFAHPHCPCTRASVSELARLVAAHPALSSRVVFLKPEGVPEGWEQTDLWRTVAAIPGALPVLDDSGVEAARFGALTSGYTAVYGTGGDLLFSGGVTPSRGHEGDSFGRRRIESILATGTADRRDSPVFGCALGHHDPAPERN